MGCQIHSVASCFSQMQENFNIGLCCRRLSSSDNNFPAVGYIVYNTALEHILDIFLGLVGKTRIKGQGQFGLPKMDST